MADQPDMAFLPKMAAIAAACSVFSRPPSALRQFSIVAMRSTLPSAFVCTAIPYFVMAASIWSVGLTRLVRPVRRAVPALLALMPALPMRPVAMAASSMEIPREPHTAPAYLKVSPIMDTVVFALLPVLTSTSAKCAESLADRPKAVRPSVMMSEVVARFSPDAAAASMIPAMPSTMSWVFQPASAMYSIACPASVAEKLVLEPISSALSRSASNSSAVAPEMDFTVDIWLSNSAVVFTAAAPTPAMAADTTVIFLPTPAMESPTFSILPPTSSIFARVVLVLAACASSDLSVCSVSWISRWSASYCCWVISPFWSCSLACPAASFSVSSFSFVWAMASFRSFCFWVTSSVLDGSSFSSFSTSFSCVWVFLISLLTPDSADDSFVVSPPISTVIPWILDAML